MRIEFVHSPDRLTTPLIRKNGKLEEASWEEAFDFTISRLKDIKDRTVEIASVSSLQPVAPMKTTTCCRNSAGQDSGPTTSIIAPVSDTLPRWQVLPPLSEVEQ